MDNRVTARMFNINEEIEMFNNKDEKDNEHRMEIGTMIKDLKTLIKKTVSMTLDIKIHLSNFW